VALREFGVRVPEHLAIATHANRGRWNAPPLPALCLQYDPAEVGETMARLLLRLMEGEPDVPECTVVSFSRLASPVAGAAGMPASRE
jgi:DNA-binding LacI/PurR family transcriptional regulator